MPNATFLLKASKIDLSKNRQQNFVVIDCNYD